MHSNSVKNRHYRWHLLAFGAFVAARHVFRQGDNSKIFALSTERDLFGPMWKKVVCFWLFPWNHDICK